MKNLKDMKEEKNTTCDFEYCSNVVYTRSGLCVLHCDKTSWKDKKNDFKHFHIHLLQYIDNKASSQHLKTPESQFNIESIIDTIFFPVNNNKYSKLSITLENIVFPNSKKYYDDSYLNYLSNLKSIIFLSCKFHQESLGIKYTTCSFIDCHFVNKWDIIDLPYSDHLKAIYSKCNFNNHVKIKANSKGEFNSSLFHSCSFNKAIYFNNTTFKNSIFINYFESNKINQLIIENCIFERSFQINNLKSIVFDIDIRKTVFKSKFECKYNSINKFSLNETNFEDFFEVFNTSFNSFKSYKCIFEDYVGFQKCYFGNSEIKAHENEPTIIKYTTFKSIANFKNTTFTNGLDIENTNYFDPPNFLKSKIAPNNTNRETFRIIKSSFDKIGNKIDSNRYFVFEMQKYREELNLEGNWQEKFIYNWNDRISSFGQSFIKPFLWLIVLLIFLYFLTIGKKHCLLYRIHPSFNTFFDIVSYHLNNIAKVFLPFKKFLIQGMEFISLIFYIMFIILIWQIIVAVKRHTKR